jgi:hypothetical protein
LEYGALPPLLFRAFLQPEAENRTTKAAVKRRTPNELSATPSVSRFFLVLGKGRRKEKKPETKAAGGPIWSAAIHRRFVALEKKIISNQNESQYESQYPFQPTPF